MSLARPPKTAARSTLPSAASRTALLPPPLKVGQHFSFTEPPPLNLARNNPAQQGEDLPLQFQRQRDLGTGKKTPARLPRRVTNTGSFDRSRPVAPSRNSPTVLILIVATPVTIMR